MASDKHLAKLREGVQAWNDWRQSEPHTRPELQGLSLTLAQKQWGEINGGPINLAQASLRDADLRHATLIRADLGGASLCGADLSCARLQEADLRNADLSRASFDDADLTGALFAGANIGGADLSRARNLDPGQLEAARGDSGTLLPLQFAVPNTWRNGVAVAATPPAVAPVAAKAGDSSDKTLDRTGDVAVEAAALVPGSFRLSCMSQPIMLLAIAVGALVVSFGIERHLSLRVSDVAAGKEPSTHVTVEPRTAANDNGDGNKEQGAGGADVEPAQRVAVTASDSTVPLEDVSGRGQEMAAPLALEVETAAHVISVEEKETEPVRPPEDTAGTVQVLGAEPTESAADRKTRMTFALGGDDASRVQNGSDPSQPIVGGGAKAYVGSFVGKPVELQKASEMMQRTDLPPQETGTVTRDPAPAKKPEPAAEPEPASEPLAPTKAAAPTPPVPEQKPSHITLAGYLSTPNKSSDWIKVFIKDYYLSGAELDGRDLRRIYASNIEYFGKRNVSLSKVAREKVQYYRDWPKRNYSLVPGSIAITWNSDKVADVTFLYDFEVSSEKKGTTIGRGWARMTMDLSRTSGLVMREDGEVIRNDRPAVQPPLPHR